MSTSTLPTGSRSGVVAPRHPQAHVAAVAAALACFAAALLVRTSDWNRSLVPARPFVAVLVTVAFFVAERVVFNVEYRRETVSFSLSEVPLAFALVFLGPVPAVAARVIGSLAAHTVARRPTSLKLAFNGAVFATEVAVESYLLRAWIARGHTDHGDLLLALVAVIAVGSALGGSLIAGAVAAFEGGLISHLRDELRSGSAVYALGAIVGAISVAPALVDGRLFVLPLIPVAVVWQLLQARGVVRQQLRDLEDLHAFTSRVGHSLDVADTARVACDETRRLLRADDVAVVVFDSDGDVLTTAALGGPLPLPRRSDDDGWSDLVALRGPCTIDPSGHPQLGSVLYAAGRDEAVVVPVRDDLGLLAVIVLAGRTGATDRFTDDDRARLTPLSDQLAVSLRKVVLHQRIEHEATHDRLTGLPGRALLEAAVSRAVTDQRPAAVYMLDIDRFKEINDTLGHHAGDTVLREFARRVNSILAPGSTFARFAGDEFAIVTHDTTPDDANRVAHEVLDQLRQPFDLGDLTVAVACSIGYALSPTDGHDDTTLLRHADLAMYDAKGRSSGTERYRPDMDTDTSDRLALLAELRAALDTDQIEVHFQPKIDLATGTVTGAEALVRWQHPRHGLLAADRFIELAERTDLIHQLSDVVLTQSLQAVRHWRDHGLDLGVAVNYSARSLFDELLADRIAHQLDRHQIPAHLLTIEVTESSVMTDVARSTGLLDRLRQLGVRVSIDDYGTGHSSLAYLRRLPATELKIDRAFITNLLIEPDDQVIVGSTIELARHLGLTVVAEGIETDAVATRLTELGCHTGQGYGFSRPLPLNKFDAWLAVSPYRPTPVGPRPTPPR